MKFNEFIAKEQRLAILILLLQSNSYRTNSSLAYSFLDQQALALSDDKLKTELTWLEEQGLVSLERLESVYIITLTKRGADVAKGLAFNDGVSRPEVV